MDDAHGAERLKLVAGGRELALVAAVREFLANADEQLTPSKRPVEAHGGCYLSRWRFERLRASLNEHSSYLQLEKQLKEAPVTWLPALLTVLVVTAEEKQAFVPGGVVEHVKIRSKYR